MKSSLSIYRIAGFFGLFSIIILALASHYLENKLPLTTLNSIKIAGEIELIHAIALLTISGLSIDSKLKKSVSLLIIIGVFCFSFSIYFLAIYKMFDIKILHFLWPITPIGGLLLASAWSLLFLKGNKIFSIKSL